MTVVYDGVLPTRKAGANLSAAQYHFVKLNASDEVLIADTITDRAFGVLQNAPIADDNAVVAVNHQTKIIAGEALAIGDLVGPNTLAQAQVAVSTQVPRGVVVTAAVAIGDYAVIRLFDTAVALA